MWTIRERHCSEKMPSRKVRLTSISLKTRWQNASTFWSKINKKNIKDIWISISNSYQNETETFAGKELATIPIPGNRQQPPSWCSQKKSGFFLKF